MVTKAGLTNLLKVVTKVGLTNLIEVVTKAGLTVIYYVTIQGQLVSVQKLYHKNNMLSFNYIISRFSKKKSKSCIIIWVDG